MSKIANIWKQIPEDLTSGPGKFTINLDDLTDSPFSRGLIGSQSTKKRGTGTYGQVDLDRATLREMTEAGGTPPASASRSKICRRWRAIH